VSVRAYEAVWQEARAKGGTLLVLLALAEHADRDTGVAWPSTRTLASLTRLEIRQVGRILATLDEDGHLDRWHHRNGSRWMTVYRITVGPYAELAGTPPLEDCLPGPPPTRKSSTRQNVASGDATNPPIRDDISVEMETTFPSDSQGLSSIEPSLGTVNGTEQALPMLGKVDRKPVTSTEGPLAVAVLAEWNQQTGQHLASRDWLSKIVMRIREYPDLTVDDHAHIIAASLAAPWWKGAPTPSVVYGSGAQFERSILTVKAGPQDDRPRTGPGGGPTPEEMARRARRLAEEGL
jgi:hypothetical protein